MLPDIIYAVASVADPHVITFAWGEWVTQLINDVTPVALGAGALATGVFAKNVFVRWLANIWVPKAINFALATTKNAAAGKVLSIEVTNNVVDVALSWLADSAPKVTKYLGDRAKDVIIAELSKVAEIPASADANSLGVKVPNAK